MLKEQRFTAMYFLFELLALVVTCMAADVVHDISDCQDSSPLCDRLGQLERLLRQLQSTVTRQDELLSEQAILLEKLRAEKARDGAELQTIKLRLDYLYMNNHFEDAMQNFGFSPAGPKRSVTSTKEIKSRSDDGGPLASVVSQMSQQMTEMNANIQAMKNSYQVIQDAQSSTFVHWGSSQCSNSSQLVYSGVVGGSYEDHPGSGTNYLCLTLSPVISDLSRPAASALLYGGEYQTYDSHGDKDPLCAVCSSPHSTTIMIPGTNVCTPGWHQHYNGFLMAGSYAQAGASEFVCVDPSFESRLGGDANHNGKLFYFTLAQCGSLPCEPYVNNKVVTCVVCSK